MQWSRTNRSQNRKDSRAQPKKVVVVDRRYTTHHAGEMDGICGKWARKRFIVVDRRIKYEVWLQLTKLNVQVKWLTYRPAQKLVYKQYLLIFEIGLFMQFL
jgi:hypothetical protein